MSCFCFSNKGDEDSGSSSTQDEPENTVQSNTVQSNAVLSKIVLIETDESSKDAFITIQRNNKEFVIINKDIKPMNVTYLAHTRQSLGLPPLLQQSGCNVFGQEYDIYNSFSICAGLTKPSNNLFINALHFAFCHHLPFVLRPDDLWLQILQGMSIHVSLNKEKLQSSIVNFADPNNKIEIEVQNDSLRACDISNDEKFENENDKQYSKILSQNNNLNWKLVFEQFTQQCEKICAKKKKKNKNKSKKNEKEESIIDWGLCDFSTSTNVCRIASQCSLFSVLSNYVSFSTETNCGIPKITLKGTIEDWKLLFEKCEKLKMLNCDFWHPHLMSVIGLIVETVESMCEKKALNAKLRHFWNSTYHFENKSGGEYVTGWCNALIPYRYCNVGTGRHSYRPNSCVGDGTDKTVSMWGTHPWEFPSSYTEAPMKWVYFGNDINCNIVGGIVGIQQNQQDGAVAPIIGWMIHQC